MKRTIEFDLELQPIIDGPPVSPEQLYQQACTGDKVTVDSWRKIWIENYQKANERFGDFGAKSMGKLHGINRNKPCICLASGPSLKQSFDALRENQKRKNPVMVVSVLHNFAALKDEGIKVDYWLSLDSGEIVLDDTTEFGKDPKETYWEKTEGEKLLAYVASPPKLFDQWKGEIFLFNALIPDMEIRNEFNKIQRFTHYISSGGNAGGAVVYAAKAVFGSSTILFCGYDFSFSMDSTFHFKPTKYDNFNGCGTGVTIKHPNIYGIPVKTWPSYMNFACWTNWLCCKIPGEWISCSEGILGAYPQGNIRQIQYMTLAQALERYWMADKVTVQQMGQNGPISTVDLDLGELFSNSKHELDITLF